MNERVVITGLGVILAGCRDAAGFWNRLRGGKSQVTEIPHLAARGSPVALGARVTGFDYRRELPDLAEQHASRYSREILITMAAAGGALRDAGLTKGSYEPGLTGFVDSTSRGPLAWWLADEGRDVASATARTLAGLPGSAATMAAIHFNLQGLVTTISNACIGGSQALGLAVHALRVGEADVMLVGGHEFPFDPGIVTALSQTGVLAHDAERPSQAMRPYDRLHSGFALGEGAIVLCLERLERARRRQARVYAELLGQKSINEANHPTTMDQSGKRAADLVGQLLAAARRRPSDLGYICGHGSATVYNDRAECQMVEQLFPDRPVMARPPLGSVKPIFGHCLGAAAIVNAAATALMLHHQLLAPTANCEQPAPDCPGDHITDGPHPADLRLAASVSHALGSQSAAMLLSTGADL
jgi:3-oxoacyl-[acyl-carrier-protein] synthase II